jgi:aryl-alcohol dehydrogenase-like predicted oxidoreductase
LLFATTLGRSVRQTFSDEPSLPKRFHRDLHNPLYIIHRWDYDTPIEETMEALHDVVKSGKVRYIGASAMYAYQFQKAITIAEKNDWTKFVSMQNHLVLLRLVASERSRINRPDAIGL